VKVETIHPGIVPTFASRKTRVMKKTIITLVMTALMSFVAAAQNGWKARNDGKGPRRRKVD
ncbi:MAG: hypothetical protein IKS49_05655, partial [Actinomycetaceae bacterium]|nr:hypothetical protein [Actinomycetaceae bacterium]